MNRRCTVDLLPSNEQVSIYLWEIAAGRNEIGRFDRAEIEAARMCV